MPYASNKDLPAAVKALPSAAQDIFRGAYNGFAKENPASPESSKQSVAWAAVNKKYKKENGKWVARDAAEIVDSTTLAFVDHYEIDRADLRITNDGYLVANPRVARAGIQVYRGSEVGIPDKALVRVWRPEEEVFHQDAARTLTHRTITLDHPSVMVTADNWKEYTVGQSGDQVMRDKQYMRVPTVVMDRAAIDAIGNGKDQLSVGYLADIEVSDGVVPPDHADAGEHYDAIQRQIRANHIAIVGAARGGSSLRIGDADREAANQRSNSMNDKTRSILVDGVQLPDIPELAASVIERSIKSLGDSVADVRTQLTKAQTDLATLQTTTTKEVADLKKQIETKDAEIVTLKKKVEDAALKPADLDKLVADRSLVVAKGRALLGDKLVIDGKTDADMRRQVVDSQLADKAKGWNDDQVRASFDTITADIKLNQQDGTRQLNNSFANPANDQRASHYDKYDDRLSNMWKGDQSNGRTAN